jgi:hypothetical protein
MDRMLFARLAKACPWKRRVLLSFKTTNEAPQHSSLLRRSVREVEPKVTCTPIHVHAAFPENVATNQNVIRGELIEHRKVTDELNATLEPNQASDRRRPFEKTINVRQAAEDSPYATVHLRCQAWRDTRWPRSRIDKCAHLVMCECRSLLRNRGEADFQIWPHLFHCPWMIKRDGQTVPFAVLRQRVIFFAHGGQIYRTYSDLLQRLLPSTGFPTWAERAVRSADHDGYCGLPSGHDRSRACEAGGPIFWGQHDE